MKAEHQHDWVEKEIKRIRVRACRICRMVQIKTKAWPNGKRWTYGSIPLSKRSMEKWAKEILDEG